MNDERATETPKAGATPAAPRPVAEDDRLGSALRALPAERAGAGFTARVLERLDEGAGGRGLPGRSGWERRRPGRFGAAGWAAAAGAAFAVVLGLALVRGWAPSSGERIAGSGSAPAEPPGAAAPGAAGSAGTIDPAAPPATSAIPPPASGVTTRDGLAAAASPGSAPVASGGPGAGAGGAESGVAGDRVSGSARSAATVPRAAAAPRAAGPRPAAAGPESAHPRPRTAERAPTAIPPDDARSALERMRAELAALRREHRRFEVALGELPEIGRDGQPVVFLGGDEGLGLVLDLGREPAAREAVETGRRPPSL